MAPSLESVTDITKSNKVVLITFITSTFLSIRKLVMCDGNV